MEYTGEFLTSGSKTFTVSWQAIEVPVEIET